MANYSVTIRNHAAFGSEVFDLSSSTQLSNVSFQLVNASDGDLFAVNETTGQVSLTNIAEVDWTGQVIRNVEIALIVDEVETERVSIDFIINEYDTVLVDDSSHTTSDATSSWQDYDFEFFSDGTGFAIAYIGGNGSDDPIHVDLITLGQNTTSTVYVHPTEGTGHRDNVDITVSPNGDYFAIAWEESQERWDSAAAEWINGTSVKAQVFNIDGSAKSSILQVSPHDKSWSSSTQEEEPSIVFLNDGRVLVSWTEELSYDGTTSQYYGRTFAKIFSRSGSELDTLSGYFDTTGYGPEVAPAYENIDIFSSHAYPFTSPWLSSVANTQFISLDDGVLAVTADEANYHGYYPWSGGTIAGVIIDQDGNASLPFNVSEITDGIDKVDYAPHLTKLSDGRIAVTWTRKSEDDSTDSMLRIFEQTGNALSAELSLTTLLGDTVDTQIGANALGGIFASYDGVVSQYIFNNNYTEVVKISETSTGVPTHNDEVFSDHNGNLVVVKDGLGSLTQTAYSYDISYIPSANLSPPAITSLSVDIDEGIPAGSNFQILVTDPESGPLTYTIHEVGVSGSSGDLYPKDNPSYREIDASLFSINENTGEVTLNFSPWYETLDYNSNPTSNTYLDDYHFLFHLDISVSDGDLGDRKNITLQIQDVDEAPRFLSDTGTAEFTYSLEGVEYTSRYVWTDKYENERDDTFAFSNEIESSIIELNFTESVSASSEVYVAYIFDTEPAVGSRFYRFYESPFTVSLSGPDAGLFTLDDLNSDNAYRDAMYLGINSAAFLGDTNTIYEFTVTATSDDTGLSRDQNFILNFNVNSAPNIDSTPVTSAAQDTTYSYTFAYSDIDTGDTLTLPTQHSLLGFSLIPLLVCYPEHRPTAMSEHTI